MQLERIEDIMTVDIGVKLWIHWHTQIDALKKRLNRRSTTFSFYIPNGPNPTSGYERTAWLGVREDVLWHCHWTGITPSLFHGKGDKVMVATLYTINISSSK